MKKKYLILDCFVDEPACFGVPPFISPYPRYIFGALVDAGVNQDKISYWTIDRLRNCDYKINESFSIIFLIGGAVVPGKYLGARIGTITEINKIISFNNNQEFAIGGMISRMISKESSNVILLKNDIEKFAYQYAINQPDDKLRTVQEIARWSVHGAQVIKLHPGFPDIICEIETYRGCPRKNHCSFCSEGLFKEIEYREEENILSEIDTLIQNGASRFRLGRQADILQYKSKLNEFRNGFPRPEPLPLKNLFSELKKRKLQGKIKVLNIDNANPGTIVNYPDESSIILEAIVDAITPGDTLALGIESFDSSVIAMNKLKVTPEEAITAVKIINQVGGKRSNGIPVLLPGINLIQGLIGETADTFKKNYTALLRIREMDLLLKRINIRKLLPFPGTEIFHKPRTESTKIINRFEYYRSKIRSEIDSYMLKQIYPIGTLLKDTIVLDQYAGYSYGKEIASYSITAKYPVSLEINSFYDSIVIGHRERSLITVPCPIHINSLPPGALKQIPGIGKKKVSEIINKSPFKEISDTGTLFESVDKNLVNKFSYK